MCKEGPRDEEIRLPRLPWRPEALHRPLGVKNRRGPLAPVKAAVFLVARRADIVGAAEDELTSRSPKYLAAEPVTHDRLISLYEKLVESLAARDPLPLLDHARQTATERFHAGYDLSEVQKAYNAVEEAIWSRVFSEGLPEKYAMILPSVSAAIGGAKDELAREYVRLAAGAHAPVVDIAALFRGGERP
jgi:hypothetical protein